MRLDEGEVRSRSGSTRHLAHRVLDPGVEPVEALPCTSPVELVARRTGPVVTCLVRVLVLTSQRLLALGRCRHAEAPVLASRLVAQETKGMGFVQATPGLLATNSVSWVAQDSMRKGCVSSQVPSGSRRLDSVADLPAPVRV